jgi:hypothetical protein
VNSLKWDRWRFAAVLIAATAMFAPLRTTSAGAAPNHSTKSEKCATKVYNGLDFLVGSEKMDGYTIFRQNSCGRRLSVDVHIEGQASGPIKKVKLTVVLQRRNMDAQKWVRYGNPRREYIGPFSVNGGSLGWPTVKWEDLPHGYWRVTVRVHLLTAHRRTFGGSWQTFYL